VVAERRHFATALAIGEVAKLMNGEGHAAFTARVAAKVVDGPGSLDTVRRRREIGGLETGQTVTAHSRRFELARSGGPN
jgi:hypothetical protein